ncbi:hypothetical protein B0H13DRAFT_2650132 [Mycena leptocephala]|nr:hypothetical protein B0H13DRAFT_2650132 [Mycena leptocephala]
MADLPPVPAAVVARCVRSGLPNELLGGVGGGGGGGGGAEANMNYFGFPQDGAARGREGGGQVESDEPTARSVLSKALVCPGDIARYWEQYKVPPTPLRLLLQTQQRPLSKPQTPTPAPHPHLTYTRPRTFYLAAHALASSEGNAAHQLGILSGAHPPALYHSLHLASETSRRSPASAALHIISRFSRPSHRGYNAQNPGQGDGRAVIMNRVLSFRIPAAWYVFHKLYQLSAHNSLSTTRIIFHAFAAASSMAVSLSARLCGLSGTRGCASAERREGNGV